jgi:APA family basic amino acid/polyamine antiporter
MSASNPGPMFMMLIAVLFSFAIAYIAARGVNGATSVNIAINVIQISALLVFSVMALSYRMNHPPERGLSVRFHLRRRYTYQFATQKQTVNGATTDVIVRDANGVPKPLLDAAGKPVPFHQLSRARRQRATSCRIQPPARWWVFTASDGCSCKPPSRF